MLLGLQNLGVLLNKPGALDSPQVITLLSYLKGVVRRYLSLEASTLNRAIPFSHPIFELTKMRARLSKHIQPHPALVGIFDDAGAFVAGGHAFGGDFCHGQIFSED